MKRLVAMKSKRLGSRFALSIVLFSILLVPWAYAADVLETPAMKTTMAAKALLVDVAEAGDRLVAIGERGHIIFSDDHGASWSQANVPVSTLLTAVYFVGEQHGWAVGHGAVVLHSDDGGQTWRKQMDGNLANEMVIEQARERVAQAEKLLTDASAESTEDLEFALEDAQFALEDAELDAEVGPSKPLLDVWFKDENVGFVVGAYGFFFKTSDGGKSWENWGHKVENSDRFHLNAIKPIVGGTLFVAGESGYVFRSQDVGETWETLESPYDGSWFGVSGNGKENQVFVFGLRGNIFFSENAGLDWTKVSTDAQESLMAAAVGNAGEIVIVGNSGVMLISNDYGANFRVQTREDRLAILGADLLALNKILLVGESGVSIVENLTF